MSKTEFHAAVNAVRIELLLIGAYWLESVFSQIGIFLYDEEVESIVAKYDIDGDGTLDYSEFVRCAGQVPTHMYSASDYDNALAGRPDPVPHTEFVLEASREEHLVSLCASIREKVDGFSGPREAFLALNRLGDAQLTVQELRRGLAARGLRVPTDDLRTLLRPYMKTDTRKRYLTIGEFTSFVQGDRWAGEAVPVAARHKQLPSSTPVPKALQMIVDAVRVAGKSALETFHSFDADGDGSVTPAELRRALQHWGHFVDMSLCVALVKRFDVSRSGTLNYRELVKLLSSVQPSSQSRAQIQPPASIAVTGDGAGRATSNLVRSKAAASARRRRMVRSSGVSDAQQEGVASFPPVPPHVATAALEQPAAVAAPSTKIMSDVSWAVYHSRSGPTKLYRDMKRHGQLGVDEDDLIYGLHRVGVKLSQEDARSLMNAFDKDRDGVLSLTEWLKLLQEAQAASA